MNSSVICFLEDHVVFCETDIFHPACTGAGSVETDLLMLQLSVTSNMMSDNCTHLLAVKLSYLPFLFSKPYRRRYVSGISALKPFGRNSKHASRICPSYIRNIMSKTLPKLTECRFRFPYIQKPSL